DECGGRDVLIDQHVNDSHAPVNQIPVRSSIRTQGNSTCVGCSGIMLASPANTIAARHISAGSGWANDSPKVVRFECFGAERIFGRGHVSKTYLLECHVGARDSRLDPVVAGTLEVVGLEC